MYSNEYNHIYLSSMVITIPPVRFQSNRGKDIITVNNYCYYYHGKYESKRLGAQVVEYFKCCRCEARMTTTLAAADGTRTTISVCEHNPQCEADEGHIIAEVFRHQYLMLVAGRASSALSMMDCYNQVLDGVPEAQVHLIPAHASIVRSGHRKAVGVYRCRYMYLLFYYNISIIKFQYFNDVTGMYGSPRVMADFMEIPQMYTLCDDEPFLCFFLEYEEDDGSMGTLLGFAKRSDFEIVRICIF